MHLRLKSLAIAQIFSFSIEGIITMFHLFKTIVFNNIHKCSAFFQRILHTLNTNIFTYISHIDT